jgi:signal transduction histidine kinase/DNA-binding response OmpR family regulator
MKGKILVVDDDPEMLDVLEIRLASLGLDVVATGHPGSAAELVAGTRFDVALVDLRMGPPDGLGLTEAFHSHQPHLPVLIMTAHATIESAVQAIQRGAFDVLTKPFIPDELPRKLARALSVRRWARDRERLLAIGEILASSGNLELVLEAVANAAMETIDAERCVVFQREGSRLVPVARAGAPGGGQEHLEVAAAHAMDKGAPTTSPGSEGRLLVAAPLVVQRGPAGALVIETPPRLEPERDDLEVLSLFSAQAAVAIRNTLEYERLRGGALTALGRMATQVAHELRNPLAGILLYARHLEHRLERARDAEGAETAHKIGAAVERLGAVVSEITAFGRPPTLHRARAALPPLLDECLTFARARRPTEGVEVVRAYDPACPEAFVDARELRKAFLNLILNALEALEGGGTLTIRTAYAPASGAVTVSVEDTGAGMSAETLARAFDMFFTTKAQGTGLGMAIARSVVERHGGELRLESAPGAGTTATVRLPLEGAFTPDAGSEP